MEIIVTWMDGKQETYRADRYRVVDGQLAIFEEYGVTCGIKDEWHIPLANIRIWKPER